MHAQKKKMNQVFVFFEIKTYCTFSLDSFSPIQKRTNIIQVCNKLPRIF